MLPVFLQRLNLVSFCRIPALGIALCACSISGLCVDNCIFRLCATIPDHSFHLTCSLGIWRERIRTTENPQVE